MKLSYASSLATILSLVTAAPSGLEIRIDPGNRPINLANGPDFDKTFECGTHSYTGKEIYLSAQRGINLQRAGETRGKHKYPHSFENDDSKGNKLQFPDDCPADTNRQEFPLMSPPYDGGKNNVKQGDERVVYYWTPGDIDYTDNPNAKYCGIMTHVGAPPGGFILC
ncbi:MAG: hypothetical protein Q9211_003250 [Gyalolechia sp. 1 TL-2023]